MIGIYAAAHAAVGQASLSRMRNQLAPEAATSMSTFAMGQHVFAALSMGKPCKYCGRTNQNRQHDNCDGCGAPKGE